MEARIKAFDLEGRVAEVRRRIDALDVERRVAAIEREIEGSTSSAARGSSRIAATPS